MKLSALFLLVTCLQVSANVTAQNITLNKKNASLESIFKSIHKQTGYEFLYNSVVLDKARINDLKLDNTPLEDALNSIFKDRFLDYRIMGKTIVINERREEKLVTEIEEVLDRRISGIVVDSTTGEPLAGVTIKVKESTIGTVTDIGGEFNLEVPDDAVLEVSFVGYESKTFIVKNRSDFNIHLTSSATGLDQLVVVGYGTQKRKDVISSISTVGGDKIKDVPVADVANTLGGRMTGIITRQSNGQPGSDGSNLFIRGIGTTGSSDPLTIVDGVPRSFAQLDPNTIESISILKDAAAVAPYGVAGANGVILITTKKGSTGGPRVTYKGTVGMQDATVLPQYVNSFEFATLKNIAAENEGNPKPYTDEELQWYKDQTRPDQYGNPDYRDLISKHALITTHNVEISGGTDVVKYYGSLGYLHQDGMWKTVKNDRYNIDLNVDVNPTSTTIISFGINARQRNSNWPGTQYGRLWELLGYDHINIGPNNFLSNGMYGNWVPAAINTSGYEKHQEKAIYTQVGVEQELPFIPGLKVRGLMAYDPITDFQKHWLLPLEIGVLSSLTDPDYTISLEKVGNTPSPELTQNLSDSYQLTYQAGLDYDYTFGRYHHVSGLVLLESKINHTNAMEVGRINYALNIDEIDMGSPAGDDMSTSGSSSRAKQVGLVTRVGYDFRNKYLIEFSGRYDGNYYFGIGNRFGFFPAVSAGWRLSEETFLRSISWITDLKIKGSYGEVGALAGGPFQYMSTFAVNSPAVILGGRSVTGISERAESNPNITWERSKKTDVGLNSTLWNGLLEVDFDYFHERRSNMLLSPQVTLPAEYGIGISEVNAGIMENNGIEIALNTSHAYTSGFRFGVGINFSYAHNRLIQIFETSSTKDDPRRSRTGRPIGTRFGYKAIGYFTEDDFEQDGTLKADIPTQPWGDVHPGDLKYADLNGDGKISILDETMIGYPEQPAEIIYGLNLSAGFKGLSLDVLFQGTGNVDAYMNAWRMQAFHNNMSAYKQNFDYWRADNLNARYPRMTSAPTLNNAQTSSWWVVSSSYLRLKSIMLAYDVPQGIAGKIGASDLRVFFAGENLAMWTKMINWDPESEGAGGNMYPQQRVLSLGLNVSF